MTETFFPQCADSCTFEPRVSTRLAVGAVENLHRVQDLRHPLVAREMTPDLDQAADVACRNQVGPGGEQVPRLPAAQLGRGPRSLEVVGPGGAAADLPLRGGDHFMAGGGEQPPRGISDALGVREVAG